MKTLLIYCVFALCFLSLACRAAAAAAAPGNQGIAQEASRSDLPNGSSATASASGGPKAAPLPGGTMCAKPDKVVFSCPLANGKKVVSICATGDVDHGEGRFYYAYGRPSAPELVYPSNNQATTNVFANSHLVYGGATGGTAYSFVNNGYKYMIYLISGTGMDDGGVLVQRVGASRAARDMKCQPGKITESEDDAVVNATMKWKSDPDIASHGLPSTD